jgi:predicted RecA/RadA family phage recombinase
MTILPGGHPPTSDQARRVSAPDGGQTRGRSHRTFWLAWAALAALAVPRADAADVREFAGFYHLVNPSQVGDEYAVRLIARVYNFGATDLTAATVTLADVGDSSANQGSLGAVSIARGESVRVTGDFTVPAAEYHLWREGKTPVLSIEYVDAAGQASRHVVELAWAVMEEE